MFKLNIYHKKLEMKECTYLTCNRPSNSWEKAKKKWARKNGEGAGLGREGERSSYSLPLTLFNVCFPPFPISRHCPPWNRLVHSGPESFFQCRCKWSIDVHLGVFDILKARTHAATIPALACVKRHFFSIFRFAVGESSWRLVFYDGVLSSIETS